MDRQDDTQNTATAVSEAERKRREARRRFLIGGAAAVPVIVTMGQKQALAASAAVCQSLYGTTHDQVTGAEDPNNSIFCHVQ